MSGSAQSPRALLPIREVKEMRRIYI